MEQKDKILLLLSMQEHPENFSDEQLQQMLDGDPSLAELLTQLALTKRAFAKRDAAETRILVDKEWQKFADEYAVELEALETKSTERKQTFFKTPLFCKAAAMFIGILFIAGMTFAAIHLVRMINNPQSQTASTKPSVTVQSSTELPSSALPANTLKTDTLSPKRPIVFDDVPLEKMLSQIASCHGKEVEFRRVEARQLRFYFVWKQDEPIEDVLHRLNLFESVTIELKDNRIVVE